MSRPEHEVDARTGRAAAAERIARQDEYVDQQIRVAMARGDFDDLPGAGKPIEGLGETHDPDWWLKKLVEREQLSVLPPALALRKEDLELDAALDRETSEKVVRDRVEDFNRRVVGARRQLEGGPPVVTPTRDVEAEVSAWRARQVARREAAAARTAEEQARPRPRARRRWWRRRP